MNNQSHLVIHASGVCENNIGEGGYAVMYNGRVLLSGHERHTTKTRVEGIALIEAMKFCLDEGVKAELVTTSSYWVNALTTWCYGWKRLGWRKKNKQNLRNVDLLKEAFSLFTNGGFSIRRTPTYRGGKVYGPMYRAAMKAMRQHTGAGYEEEFAGSPEKDFTSTYVQRLNASRIRAVR